MSRIGILTFHSPHNFGSMLQAYAMQKFLEKNGHYVKIIDHYSYEQKARYPKLSINFTSSTIKAIVRHPILTYQKYKGWYKFRDFERNYLNLTRHATILNEVKIVIEEEYFDYVLCAGDQIWNVNCLDLCLAYFLPFKIQAKKIAFAPSLGNLFDWNPYEYSAFFQAVLRDYKAISVREKTASQIMSNILQKQVDVMPDPAWLITPEEYESVMTQPDKPIEGSGQYILYYSPASDAPLEWSIQYAKNRGKKLVVLSKVDECFRNVSYRLDIGPGEFLNYVKFADEIIGCSLHLLIFSVLFNKNFIILRFSEDCRLSDLMTSVGLEDRFVSINTDPKSFVPPISLVDEVTSKRVELYRKQALEFFANAI